MGSILADYWRSRRGFFVFWLLNISVFVGLGNLYKGISRDYLVYATQLCGFLLFLATLVDFWMYKRKVEQYSRLSAKDPEVVHKLPKDGKNLWETKLCEMVEELEGSMQQLISEKDSQQQEMMEFYTLWVHQIKTPIAATQLLLDTEEFSVKKDIKMQMFYIEQYVETALQVSRMHQISTDYILKEYDVEEVAKKAVRKYAKLFIMKQIQMDFQPFTYKTVTDAKWLQFVLEQILSNAIKYTKTGTVRIYMDTDSNGDYLAIEDTGLGIEPEDLPRVFEKGYTGYNGRKDKKSTGIGLYLCREILQKLGHEIVLESTVGVGTKVKLYLKRKPVEVVYE